MYENRETPLLSQRNPGGRRSTIGRAIEILLFVVFSATVLLALLFDSRLYYGISVEGLPIHRRVTLPFDMSRDPSVLVPGRHAIFENASVDWRSSDRHKRPVTEDAASWQPWVI